MSYPPNYRYTREHEWIDVQGKTGKVGITDHAQESLGDIVFVELPQLGTRLEQGKVFGSVESVKAVSDLYSPVTGTVSEVNKELETSPEKINQDAHSAWILKVEIADPAGLDGLLSAEEYEAYAKEEAQ